MKIILNPFRAMRRRLIADEAGTSILELALCSPILVTFIVGIVDVAMYAAARLQAAQGVYRGMEIVQVNTSMPSMPDDATIRSQVVASAGYGVDDAHVSVNWELRCAGGAPKAITDTCANGEEIARYVTVSATGVYTPMLPSMTSNFFSNAEADGDVPFTVAASVRVQ